MYPLKIGFVGLGHIGGSIAKTIRRLHPDIEITACDPSENTIRQALEAVGGWRLTGCDKNRNP